MIGWNDAHARRTSVMMFCSFPFKSDARDLLCQSNRRIAVVTGLLSLLVRKLGAAWGEETVVVRAKHSRCNASYCTSQAGGCRSLAVDFLVDLLY